jgi:type III secretion system FlhB-like substrate exporter
MSLENHPNLHAVGLLTDIIEAIAARMRGLALGKNIPNNLYNKVVVFVEQVEEQVDQEYGGS